MLGWVDDATGRALPAPTVPPPVPAPRSAEDEDRDAIRSILAAPGQITVVYQPIVDLTRGVVAGYEALSRFPSRESWTPDRWFKAADAHGLGAELEACVVAQCLAARASLPPDCFLSVNVSPHLLTSPPLADLLLDAGDLAPLVLELTEHVALDDITPLVALLTRLREQGALVALDDTGTGYSGLQQLALVRPQLVKLDRALVADADRDEVKLALAELMGQFAGRVDAWLLAEGVERWGELQAFMRLGVPLAQGYLLGRPAPPWSGLSDDLALALRAGAAKARLVEHVVSLVEPPVVEGEDVPVDGEPLLRLDDRRRPVAMLLPRLSSHPVERRRRTAQVSLRVPASAAVTDVARQAMVRPLGVRFDPVICVDAAGAAVGVVRVERLMMRLADLTPPAEQPAG